MEELVIDNAVSKQGNNYALQYKYAQNDTPVEKRTRLICVRKKTSGIFSSLHLIKKGSQLLLKTALFIFCGAH